MTLIRDNQFVNNATNFFHFCQLSSPPFSGLNRFLDAIDAFSESRTDTPVHVPRR